MIEYNEEPEDYATSYNLEAITRWQHQQREILRPQVTDMSNKDLLDQCLYLAGGDSYDGEMSTGGGVLMELLENELYYRLTKKGWLPEEQNDNAE